MSEKTYLNVTLVRSPHGRMEAHKACLRGIGLKRMHQTVRVEDNPCVRGMLAKVAYLIRVS